MKVLLTVPRAANRATGPTVAIAGLQRALLRRGVDATVHGAVPRVGTTGKVALEAEKAWHVHRAHSFIPGFETTRVSPAMYRSLATGVSQADVVHNNGMWAGITTITGYAADRAGRPVVWSPRGTLDPVAFGQRRRSKNLQWRFVQERILERVACFHATCEHEAVHLRDSGLRVPIATVPHGIDVPDIPRQPDAHDSLKQVLFLSRIAPVKGLPLLVDVWSELESRYSNWELVIAGPDWRGHRKEVESLIARRQLKRVRFVGEVHGTEKTKVFADADLFVLPSRAENFGLVIAEALGHGVPVIVTLGTPWHEVAPRGCGWWIERSVESLHETMQAAMGLPEDTRREMGRRGRRWMIDEFSWDAIARKMELTYRWVVMGGEAPAWVELR